MSVLASSVLLALLGTVLAADGNREVIDKRFDIDMAKRSINTNQIGAPEKYDSPQEAKRFDPFVKRFDLYKRFDPFVKRFDPFVKRFDLYKRFDPLMKRFEPFGDDDYYVIGKRFDVYKRFNPY